jgi:hypothetical protein
MSLQILLVLVSERVQPTVMHRQLSLKQFDTLDMLTRALDEGLRIVGLRIHEPRHADDGIAQGLRFVGTHI